MGLPIPTVCPKCRKNREQRQRHAHLTQLSALKPAARIAKLEATIYDLSLEIAALKLKTNHLN